jgi:hypothetical protein
MRNINRQLPQAQARSTWPLIRALCATFAAISITTMALASAPALTGAGFGHSHLTAAQLRSVVTQSMPLTAPGSLKPEDYAAVMAFLLSYDCVQASGDGQPFPTMDLPALQQVTVGATTCVPSNKRQAQASTIAGSQ